MIHPRLIIVPLAIGCLSLALAPSSGQPPAGQKVYLLNFGKGQIPSDTGLDDKTTPEIVDSKELGGKALKVAFAAGDSFGAKAGAAKNWKPFSALRFDVFNPSQGAVALELNVIHGRSTNYQTRVVVPIKLKAGKNEVKIGIDELTNVNGSAPDLANVVRWYIGDVASKGPTLYFGDIYLDGAGVAPPVVGQPGMQPPLIGYHIKGKVGGLEVDLKVTPFVVPSDTRPASKVVVKGDPSRVARIRAAKMPKIDKPVMFNTPEADAICSALEVFPEDNPWNLVVEDWPLHPNSKNIIASIGADKPFRYNDDMAFILVPPDQKKVDVKLVSYPAESDKGPFPVPDNIPIEGWPSNFQRDPKLKNLTLDDVQRDKIKQDGDRHAIVVDPATRMLYEFYQLKKTDNGWQAACSAIFDLKSNRLRPDGWTSSDAAGLPIFPATVRYDELQRGAVEHALRVTVVKTRRAYVYPATHFASKHTDENMPRMGERIRLRKDFDISGFTPEVQTILKALKKYGMLVADNGIDWAISVAPDPRIKVMHDELRKIKGSDFEVIEAPAGYQPPE
ncbi:MAG: hypothetical protein K2R98_34300 [Gemmataceae bacterium]|nr:hypothetical protein [Gemmataceae bacterium]